MLEHHHAFQFIQKVISYTHKNFSHEFKHQKIKDTLKMTMKTDFELIIVGHNEQANCDGSEEGMELLIQLSGSS
jgi:predicted nucleotidyltransferase